MFVVSVMPCIAKKFERQREELKNEKLDNVDAVITTRELARMIKQANIDFVELEDSKFDNPMGEASRRWSNIWSNRRSDGSGASYSL